MALYFDIEVIQGRSVSADGSTVTVDLAGSVTDAVRLNMSSSTAAKLVDALTALNVEATVKQELKAAEMEAEAYREFDKVAVNLDASGSVLLIDFDRGKPHHIGVAVSIEKCQALVQTLKHAAEIGRALRQSQTRQ